MIIFPLRNKFSSAKKVHILKFLATGMFFSRALYVVFKTTGGKVSVYKITGNMILKVYREIGQVWQCLVRR